MFFLNDGGDFELGGGESQLAGLGMFLAERAEPRIAHYDENLRHTYVKNRGERAS